MERCFNLDLKDKNLVDKSIVNYDKSKVKVI